MTTRINFKTRINAFKDFDDTPIEPQHVASHSHERNGGSNSFAVHTHTQRSELLLAALVEGFCHISENKENAAELYRVTCQRLNEFGALDSNYAADSFAGLRQTARSMLASLMPKRNFGTPQICLGSSWWYDGLGFQKSPFITMLPHFQFRMPTQATGDNKANVISRYLEEFEEIALLGKGAFGSVYKVRNKLDRQLYAVKRVSPMGSELNNGPKVIREVKSLARLSHPNIVRYHGSWFEVKPSSFLSEPSQKAIAFEEENSISARHSSEQSLLEASDAEDSSIVFQNSNDGDNLASNNDSAAGDSGASWSASHASVNNQSAGIDLYIQTELCDMTLHDWLRDRNERMTSNYSDEIINQQINLQFLRDILSGLAYLHSQTIIHRDLKPRNIFLCKFEKDHYIAKLGDFGLARHLKSSSPLTPHPGYHASVTSETLVLAAVQDFYTAGVGTTIYAAPEQLDGKLYTEKSDMFSLGLLWFELYYPFSTGMERAESLGALRKGILPQKFLSDWPLESSIILSLVSLDPSKRPSAAELLSSELFQSKDLMMEELREALNEKTWLLEERDRELAECSRRMKVMQAELAAKERELNRLRRQLQKYSIHPSFASLYSGRNNLNR